MSHKINHFKGNSSWHLVHSVEQPEPLLSSKILSFTPKGTRPPPTPPRTWEVGAPLCP